MRFTLVLLVLAAVWVTMAASSEIRPLSRLASKIQNPNMFEISTRPWLYLLSQKYGRNISLLSEIPDEELAYLASQHIDIVWFMGVWSLGAYGLNFDRTTPSLLQEYAQMLPGYTMDDIIGSPYAVTQYVVNPQLGSDADLAKLRERLHSYGMLLMVDFVPNHSAVDCPYTTSNPDYYVRAPRGTQPPYDPSRYLPSGIAYGNAGYGQGWMDTAQFNYWNPELVKMRVAELLKVAAAADAIRCDMAFLLLNDQIQQNWNQELSSWGYTRPAQEFWQSAIQEVRAQYPDTIFLAETYSNQSYLQQLGFDYTYDKDLYDRLGWGNLDQLRSYLWGLTPPYATASAHFVENHDEPRAASFFGSWWRADAAALATFTLPGMRFHYQGQWDGLTKRIDIHLRRAPAEPPVPAVQTLYGQLMNITSEPVFKQGSWSMLGVSGSSDCWRLVAWKWVLDGEKRLVVVNYSDSPGSGSVVLPDAQGLPGNDTVPVTDLLSGETYYRSASAMRTQGLFVVVNQWYAQIFKYL